MEEKKQEIIQAARQMFMDYGIRSVSMDDISKSISISKKTLYHHFDNKAALLEALLELEMEYIKTQAEGIKAEARDAIHALFLVSKAINNTATRSKPVVTFDLKKYYPGLLNTFVKMKQEFTYEGIAENVRRGIKEGIYREDLNVDVVARLYVKKVEQMHDKDLMEDTDCSAGTIFEIMFENHIRGIANAKGIEIFEKEKENLNFNINDNDI
ncbi:MAG: TetR/AcrR family transcriptional regulator [Bacteroidales bacterium]